MNIRLVKYLLPIFIFSAIILSGCEKIEDTRTFTPTVSFDKATAAIKADVGIYPVKILLSQPAQKEINAKIEFSGTAIKGEHYSVESNSVKIPVGAKEATFNITLLNNNIFDESLEIKCMLAAGQEYAIQPQANPVIAITITKQILLPTLSFKATDQNKLTNPFLGQTLNYELQLSEALRVDTEVRLNIEGGLTIGADFLINGGNTNLLVIPKGVLSKVFDISIKKKDAAGFNQSLKITLVPITPKSCVVTAESSIANLKVNDPVIDFAPFLKSPALLSGAGYIAEQAIKATDGTYAGKVTVNLDKNQSKANYLKSFRNTSFNTAFACNTNSPGGDILRLAELLNFANTDTVIADYGVGKTTRYFSPSDSLLRFVAEGENIRKGTITASPQKFIAKLVKKVDWETGSNGFKQWNLDSKLTNGNINQTSYSLIFDVIEINLVRLEGTFNIDDVVPSIYFDVWLSSNSKYFMKNLPTSHNIVKEGNLYKISYKFTPK